MTVRFAPSPTGRFHLGNLRTAWVSHRLARELKLPWWVRFEDIDTPRVIEGAREQQLQELAQLGLVPDHVEIQHTRRPLHREAFEKARQSGLVFPCICSRREVQVEVSQAASAPHFATSQYPGTCLTRGIEATLEAAPKNRAVTWRFKGSGVVVARIHGDVFEPSYHWACAIDDARTEPEHQVLVRACDLEQAAAVQRQIQKALYSERYVPPAIFHTLLVTADDGSRLEKRTRGVTLSELNDLGYPPQHLIERFEASLTLPASLASLLERGSLFSEPQRNLTVSKLLGSPSKTSPRSPR
jgi:glutamyl-tRNA synthetase